MGFFGCFSSHKKKASKKTRGKPPVSQPHKEHPRSQHMSRSFSQARPDNHRRMTPEARHNYPNNSGGNNNIAAETFTFRELASATKNFRQECLLGEGGFGRVYKGRLDKTGQIVAVKQLDRNGLQGNKEFLVEVLMLSLLHNQNLVNLIGYCADGEQRLLVYEFMALGSLEDHLLELPPGHPALPWSIRMKIALNAARGLEYLHDKANPPVIYRDLKSSNILLDKEYNAKLSDFGLAKLGPVGDNSHVSSRVMGTYGYCAPEYQKTGQLTVKSDVYSFGVVLLEIITGKRVIDNTRRSEEQNLVTWAEPIFKEPKRFSELVDPLLRGDYPKKNFNQAVAVAAMCLQEDAHIRPSMSDVVTALSFLGWEPDTSISCRSLQRSESSRSHQSGISAVERLKSHQSEISALERRKRNQSEISAIEREKAVAEAKEWGSRSRRSSICT